MAGPPASSSRAVTGYAGAHRRGLPGPKAAIRRGVMRAGRSGALGGPDPGRGGELVDPSGHVDVASGHPTRVMAGQRDRDGRISEMEVRMVIGGLRGLADPVHEGEPGGEVAGGEIGRASCRGRGWRWVSGVGVKRKTVTLE